MKSRLLLLLLVLCCAADLPPVPPPSTNFDTMVISFGWDPSIDSSVTGYKLYYGPSPRTYTNSVNSGTNTQITISNLNWAVSYYFAATAYNATGNESDFSNELAVTNAPPLTNFWVDVTYHWRVTNPPSPAMFVGVFSTTNLRSWQLLPTNNLQTTITKGYY